MEVKKKHCLWLLQQVAVHCCWLGCCKPATSLLNTPQSWTEGTQSPDWQWIFSLLRTAVPPTTRMLLTHPSPRPLKRPRWESHRYLPPTHCLPQQPLLNTAPPLAPPSSGRYVSKRERALLPSSQAHVESGSPLPPLTGVEFDCTGELSGPSLQQI